MIPVFSREGRAMIDRAAAERALLAFDFDGTLAPIVVERDRAEMRPETRSLLCAASALYPCVVVSGRSRADVARRVARVPIVAVVGDHGADLDDAPLDLRVAVRVRSWAAALEAALRALPGVDIEVKRQSLAVHHRNAALDGAARLRIAALAAALPGARVFGGDEVVNVVPANSRTKGGAVEVLSARERAATVLYVGDDVTDEDAFCSPAVAYPVRVGSDERSAARYFLEEQRQIDDLLRALVNARERRAFARGFTFPADRGDDR